MQGASVAAINRNQGAGEAAGRALVNPGQRQLQGTLFGLGKEQDEYKSGLQSQAKASIPGYNAADISNVGSDTGAFTRISDALGADKNFKPLADYNAGVNTQINNPTLTGNYASILQKEKGPTYGKGMALLDQTLFNRAPNRQGDLANQYVGMQDQVVGKVNEGKGIKAPIEQQRQTDFNALKNQISGGLGDAFSQQLAADNQYASNLQQQDRTSYQQLIDNILRENPIYKQTGQTGSVGSDGTSGSRAYNDIGRIAGNATDKDVVSRAQDKLTGLDINNFINRGDINSINPTAGGARTQQSADQLNALKQLLGREGEDYTAGSYKQMQAPSFNRDAYSQKVAEIQAAAEAEQAAVLKNQQDFKKKVQQGVKHENYEFQN